MAFPDTEKQDLTVHHSEASGLSDNSGSATPNETSSPGAGKALLRKQDIRPLPLCAYIYLLCRFRVFGSLSKRQWRLMWVSTDFPHPDVCMITAAVFADRYNARGLVACVSAFVGSIDSIASAALSPAAFNARYGCLINAASGAFWVRGLAIALNISLAAPGQITGVWIYKAQEAKAGFPTGHWTNTGCLLGLAVSSFALQAYYRRQNGLVTAGPEYLL